MKCIGRQNWIASGDRVECIQHPVRRMYIPTLDGEPTSERNERFLLFPDTRRARPAELKVPPDAKHVIKWEIPRLCRGGIRSLTIPGVCPCLFCELPDQAAKFVAIAFDFDSTGCDQAPLRGQQP